jgi:primase-polymerase (primpol)-like protein
VSPSGLGVKIWVRGVWPADAENQNAEHGIEVYSEGRYFAVTGVRVEGSPAGIRECQSDLDWLRETYFPRSQPKPPTASPPADGKSNSTAGGSGHKLNVAKYLAANGRAFRVKDKSDKRGRTRYVLAEGAQ